jgi:hypothetical protein
MSEFSNSSNLTHTISPFDSFEEHVLAPKTNDYLTHGLLTNDIKPNSYALRS